MLSAAILAGGGATRFGGRDKSALVVDGQTILDRQLSQLSKIANEILYVHGAIQPEAAHPTPGVIHIADLTPGCGPLGGLHAALTAARHHVVVVVACDMPYVSAAFLAYLASLISAEAASHSAVDEYLAVVPQTERRYHPLCAAYTRAAIAPIEGRLATGRLKMTDLLEEVRPRVVTAEEIARFGDPQRLLTNVNTPGEYENLGALHNHEL
jgi:molybdopterin-guanine dinucleotide biosynthesis protein A